MVDFAFRAGGCNCDHNVEYNVFTKFSQQPRLDCSASTYLRMLSIKVFQRGEISCRIPDYPTDGCTAPSRLGDWMASRAPKSRLASNNHPAEEKPAGSCSGCTIVALVLAGTGAESAVKHSISRAITPSSWNVRFPRDQYSPSRFNVPMVKRIFSRLVASFSPWWRNRQAERCAMVALATMQMRKGVWMWRLVGRVSNWSRFWIADRHFTVCSSDSALSGHCRRSDGASGAHRATASMGL